ncbi:hypothetical protein Aab01nite_01080 [Paractinoplanes abujensis]|uniref:Uncharacterized protein n=1 Tax=Paractinoplanes abujensis TaxID=882441 RepID=A0A7W7G2W8_9ACTN|nr:hypothetical protein [Actinoplanes abujensis]MBB4692066.1 hypothetical protein [Actinoplanes abujensis]GID16518.1 hypothetical protein Aab01nite_01080 [Actinoplanes abujensis]
MSYEEKVRPRVVEAGAALVALIGVITIARVAYGVVDNLAQDDWEAGARGVFLVLNGISLVFAAFFLVLADQVRRGRMWAWIAGLIMLPFAFLFGALMLVITATGGGLPWFGASLVVAGVAAFVTLLVPRAARDFFNRPAVPRWTPSP